MMYSCEGMHFSMYFCYWRCQGSRSDVQLYGAVSWILFVDEQSFRCWNLLMAFCGVHENDSGILPGIWMVYTYEYMLLCVKDTFLYLALRLELLWIHRLHTTVSLNNFWSDVNNKFHCFVSGNNILPHISPVLLLQMILNPSARLTVSL